MNRAKPAELKRIRTFLSPMEPLSDFSIASLSSMNQIAAVMATYLYQNESKQNKVLSIADGQVSEVHQMGNLSPIESTPTKEITVEGYFGVGMGDSGFSLRDEDNGESTAISVLETWAVDGDTVIRAAVL